MKGNVLYSPSTASRDIHYFCSPFDVVEFVNTKGSSKSVKSKRSKTRKVPPNVSLSSGSEPEEIPSPQSSFKITRQLTVKEVRTITEIPSTWTVFDGAWILDLTDDNRDWKDSKSGILLSMAAIIKSQVCIPSPLDFSSSLSNTLLGPGLVGRWKRWINKSK